jgi:polysaccharide biosynthesis/export protein
MNLLNKLMRLTGGVAAFVAGLMLAVPLASLAQTPAAGAGSAQYRLAPGDVIRITVFQSTDLTLDARVNEAGVISYPLLGSVALGGLTLPQAEKRIVDGLRDGNFVKQPQVSILVTQVRGHQVSVLGQVGRPGRFPLEQADTKLTDIIATAGGINTTGADTVIVVGRRNGQPYRAEFDMQTLFNSDQRSGDLTLQTGDVVWVDRAPVVYMYGEVQRPGSLRLERGMTVMQALASAGGLTQRGTERGMRVHRRDAQGKVKILELPMTDPLRPDDVVYVRESIF